MTAVKESKVVPRSERQASERKYWQREAASLLITLGIFGVEEQDEASEYAARLCYRYTDEGGELVASPEEAVDDDMSYDPR